MPRKPEVPVPVSLEDTPDNKGMGCMTRLLLGIGVVGAGAAVAAWGVLNYGLGAEVEASPPDEAMPLTQSYVCFDGVNARQCDSTNAPAVISMGGNTIPRLITDSPKFEHAFLVAEDSGFVNDSNGTDERALARVFFKEFGEFITEGDTEIDQGASTLTDMFTALSTGSSGSRLMDRLNELGSSADVREEYTPAEILTFISSYHYLGCRAYGVEAIYKAYAGTDADPANMTYADAAEIAILFRSPGALDGFDDTHDGKDSPEEIAAQNEKRRERRNELLQKMANETVTTVDGSRKTLTQEDVDQYIDEPLIYEKAGTEGVCNPPKSHLRVDFSVAERYGMNIVTENAINDVRGQLEPIVRELYAAELSAKFPGISQEQLDKKVEEGLQFELDRSMADQLRINLTIDAIAQGAAARTVSDYRERGLLPTDGRQATVVMQETSGEVKVYYAGYYGDDEAAGQSKVDWLQQYVQGGSSRKPFIYLFAHQAGVIDENTVFPDSAEYTWQSKEIYDTDWTIVGGNNCSREGFEPCTVDKVIARSSNAPVIRILDNRVLDAYGEVQQAQLGPDSLNLHNDFMTAIGAPTNAEVVTPAFGLGADGRKPFDMATAYNIAFANEGEWLQPYTYDHVRQWSPTTGKFELIIDNTPTVDPTVTSPVSAESSRFVFSGLKEVVGTKYRGTASGHLSDNYGSTAGKTGSDSGPNNDIITSSFDGITAIDTSGQPADAGIKTSLETGRITTNVTVYKDGQSLEKNAISSQTGGDLAAGITKGVLDEIYRMPGVEPAEL